MPHLKVHPSFIKEILENKFLKKHCEDFSKAVSEGRESASEFLDKNPDFLQMMMNLTEDERIEWLDDENHHKFLNNPNSPM